MKRGTLVKEFDAVLKPIGVFHHRASSTIKWQDVYRVRHVESFTWSDVENRPVFYRKKISAGFKPVDPKYSYHDMPVVEFYDRLMEWSKGERQVPWGWPLVAGTWGLYNLSGVRRLFLHELKLFGDDFKTEFEVEGIYSAKELWKVVE